MSKLDRALQRSILEELAQAYPDSLEFENTDLKHDANLQPNLFYLHELGLIEHEAVSRPLSLPPHVLTAAITAQGLDFLADDGGLSAILNVVTVRFEADTLKAILAQKISDSALPEEEKKNVLLKLKSFSSDVLKAVVIKVIEKGIDGSEQLNRLIAVIRAAGPSGF